MLSLNDNYNLDEIRDVIQWQETHKQNTEEGSEVTWRDAPYRNFRNMDWAEDRAYMTYFVTAHTWSVTPAHPQYICSWQP